MIRRPPRSTRVRSSAASDVYKRQLLETVRDWPLQVEAVSYTHLRAHETRGNLVCRLLLEKKNTNTVFSVRTPAGLPRQKMLPKHKLTLRFSGWLDAFAPGGACPGHPVAVTLAGCFLNGLKTEPQSGKPLRGVPPLPGQPFPPSTLQNGRAVWRSAKGVQELSLIHI